MYLKSVISSCQINVVELKVQDFLLKFSGAKVPLNMYFSTFLA